MHPKSKIEGSLKSLGGGDWFGAAAAVGVIAKKALEESERDYSEVCAVLEGLITKIEVGSSSTYRTCTRKRRGVFTCTLYTTSFDM